MISSTAEYALRAIVVLATAGGARTAQEISVQSKVPQDYLAKILHALAKAGLVAAQRGRGGGFVLSHSPQTVTVLDVVTAVDPLRRITRCPLGIASHGTVLCPLHKKLDDAVRSVEEAFASTTMADILAEPTTSRPLCEGDQLYNVQVAH
jgi:Rrf2 family transcriptional regulator, nitric oxide-sensitive transcriptional repressor